MSDYEAGIKVVLADRKARWKRTARRAIEAALAEWGRCRYIDRTGECVKGDQCECTNGRVPFGVVPDGDGWRIVPLAWQDGGYKRIRRRQVVDSDPIGRRLIGPWEPS